MLLITRFNKLIRNKLIWAFIAIVISVSFVLVGFASRGCDGDTREGPSAGTLFGNNVSPRELAQAQYFEMGLRRDSSVTDEQRVALRKRAWMRMAALEMGQRMGIRVSDAQVAQAIQQDPTFQENGAFSRLRYQAVVERQLSIPVALFEQYLRQELTIRLLGGVLETAVWASPHEVNEKLNNLTDRFTVEVALLETNAVADVKATDEQVQTYFDENTEQFAIPEKVSVRYVSFPISNHMATVTVTDAEVADDYTNNIATYTSTDTNGTETVTPLADVSASIMEELKRQKSTFETKDTATEFVVALAGDRYGNKMSFEEAAASWKTSIRTSALFTASEAVPGLDVGPNFNKAAFALTDDEENYFSDAIVGEENVYVLAVSAREEERIPELAEVRDQVVPLADADAKNEALLEKAGEVRKTVMEKVAGGAAFSAALQAMDLNVVTTKPFSVYEGIQEDMPSAYRISREVVSLASGEISEAVGTTDGAMILHVVRREPGDIAQFSVLRPQLVETLDRYRSNMVFNRWGEHLLALAEHVDLQPIETEEDEDDGESAESDDA